MATFAQGKADLVTKWNKDYTLKTLVLIGVPSLILGIFFHIAIFAWLFFIVSFTCFDILGFGNVEKISALNKAEDIPTTMNYRIIQNVYYVIALILVGMATMTTGSFLTFFIVPLFCITSHICTTCDYLFYVLQKNDIPTNADDWLDSWSIFGILKPLGFKADANNFTTMALLGIIIAIVGILLF